jgi:hypothetical protein
MEVNEVTRTEAYLVVKISWVLPGVFIINTADVGNSKSVNSMVCSLPQMTIVFALVVILKDLVN